MAGIGGISCTFVHGEFSELRQRTRIWQRPGYNGIGAQLMGLGHGDAQMRAVLYADYAAGLAWVDSINALQGQLVSVVDDHATTWENVLIHSVGRPQRRRALIPGGTGYRFQLPVQGVLTQV